LLTRGNTNKIPPASGSARTKDNQVHISTYSRDDGIMRNGLLYNRAANIGLSAAIGIIQNTENH